MKRKLYYELEKESDSNKISLIVGPRQVGKTTLLKQLKDKFKGVYIDFDVVDNVERFGTYKSFINSLKLEGYDEKDKFYVFIDEFQNHSGFAKVLKNIYDNHKNIKIYASGSSSVKIKNEVQESLAGRKFLHYLYPLDFEEFLLFKKEDINRLKKLTNFEGELPVQEFKELLEEFMIFGSYPEVVLSNDKKKILDSIFDLFIKKDLVNYLKLDEVIGMKKLIQYISVNNAKKLNISELSHKLGLARYKTESYLEILEETFILKRVAPYYVNKNKEITKAYKEYFIDPGVRNYFCNNFNSFDLRNDVGFLFETFVLGEIVKNSNYEVKFWEDKRKNEVDFIIDKVHDIVALEIKYKDNLKSSDYKGLSKLNIAKSYLVNLKKQDNKHLLPFSINSVLD